MDLSSSGIRTILILAFCASIFGQIIIEDNSDNSYHYGKQKKK